MLCLLVNVGSGFDFIYVCIEVEFFQWYCYLVCVGWFFDLYVVGEVVFGELYVGVIDEYVGQYDLFEQIYLREQYWLCDDDFYDDSICFIRIMLC